MKLLPKSFSSGLKKVAGEFARGVWSGMSPGQERKPLSKLKKRRSK